MSIEESPNEAVRSLRTAYENQYPAESAYVTVSKEAVDGVLGYIAELESKVPAEPVRPFKVGDKVQEVTDDEDKPWGYVIEVRDNGCSVKLENTKYSGRKLLYFDDEIEPFAEPLAIGDEVKVVAEHVATLGGSVIGERGTLINIEPHADNYPYSVRIRLFAGMGSQVMYFARTELKKVEQ